jgi:hypothetical protein
MQFAATTTAGTGRDKTSWPRIQPLPHDLPAPATPTGARQQVWAKFSAGSLADDRTDLAARMTPTWDWEASDPKLDAVRLLGRDPRAALAAAAVLAGQRQLSSPCAGNEHPTPQQTAIGLYQSAGGWLVAVPLWQTPGTNDAQPFYARPISVATTPDARFTFRDDRLLAVVATDGFILNPAHAASFEA